MLWTAEDDEALNGDNELNTKILERYKGTENMTKRR